MKKLPLHLARRPELLAALRHQAALARKRYWVPVYLVGSALRDQNPNPRDWDIRLSLTAPAFDARFGTGTVTPRTTVARWLRQGQTGAWGSERYAWSGICVRESRAWSRRLSLNVDFQIYPPAFWRTFDSLPRLRLA